MIADEVMKGNELTIAVDIRRPDIISETPQFIDRQRFQQFYEFGILHWAKIAFPTNKKIMLEINNIYWL